MTGVKGDWELTAAQRHSLQQVQNTIAELPPVVERAMLWLVVVSVSATPQGAHEDAEDIITTLLQSGGCELHVHHFDATSESDPAYQSYMQLEWYRRARPRFRRVFFRTETGCKLEQWRESMRLLLSTSTGKKSSLLRSFRPHYFFFCFFIFTIYEYAHAPDSIIKLFRLDKQRGFQIADISQHSKSYCFGFSENIIRVIKSKQGDKH
jgi:hypothetical protein